MNKLKNINNKILALFLLLFPILVIGVAFEIKPNSLNSLAMISDNGTIRDFFYYYRMILLCIIAPILFLTRWNKKKNIKYLILALLFINFLLITYFLSPVKSVITLGINNNYQGLITWFAYIILFSSFLFDDFKLVEIRSIMKFLYCGVFFVLIIGIFQFVGKNFYHSYLGYKIMTLFLEDSSYKTIESSKYFYQIYGTLGNPNIMGLFVNLLIFPIIGFIITSKSKTHSLIGYTYYILLLINLIGSRSRGGFIALIISFIFFIVVFGKNSIKYYDKILKLFILGILVYFLMNFVIQKYKINEKIDDDLSIISSNQSIMNNLIDLEIDDDYLKIVRKKYNLYINSRSNGDIQFYDENKVILNTYRNDGKLKIKNGNYSNFSFQRSKRYKNLYLLSYGKNFKFNFIVDDNKFFTTNVAGKIIPIKNIPRSKYLDGLEDFASARGYIWTRAIPLLRFKPFFGFGPNSFSLIFPQSDYFGKLRSYGTKNMLIDKPHNIYLDALLSFGIFGTIILGGIILLYFYDMFSNIYSKEIENNLQFHSLFISIGIFGYLINGFFTDHSVSVTPYFFLLLGLSISINSKIKNKMG